MKRFDYEIKDEMGVHARPAGLLVRKVSEFSSEITIETKCSRVSAKKLFGIMGLAAKKGDLLTFTIDGPDEETAAAEVQKFLTENL